MNFGSKMFLISFLMIIIVVNGIGIILINNSFETNIEQEIEKNIASMNVIMNASYYYTGELTYMIRSYQSSGDHTKIYRDEDIFYNDFSEDLAKIEANLINDNSELVNVYINNKEMYLGMQKDNYKIIISSRIDDIYNNRDKQIEYFIKISLLTSLGASLILSILVILTTRKLKKLKKVTEEIEKGSLDIDIPDLGNDEIGSYAISFRSMKTSIQNNMKEIERISENRKIFIGNLTHELRTPLTSIIGYSSLIKNGKVKNMESIKEYNERIYKEGKYIEDMRDKLMELILLDNNKIEKEKSNLASLIKEYINELKQIYPKVVFKINLEETVYKDINQTLFKSLIFNLIKNGIEASKEPVIEIVLTNNNILIKDNGIGIKKEEIEKIKEPFYTLKSDRNRASSGLGLGLTLCMKIIEVHNWKLDITSSDGTTVKIEMSD